MTCSTSVVAFSAAVSATGIAFNALAVVEFDGSIRELLIGSACETLIVVDTLAGLARSVAFLAALLAKDEAIFALAAHLVAVLDWLSVLRAGCALISATSTAFITGGVTLNLFALQWSQRNNFHTILALADSLWSEFTAGDEVSASSTERAIELSFAVASNAVSVTFQ